MIQSKEGIKKRPATIDTLKFCKSQKWLEKQCYHLRTPMKKDSIKLVFEIFKKKSLTLCKQIKIENMMKFLVFGLFADGNEPSIIDAVIESDSMPNKKQIREYFSERYPPGKRRYVGCTGMIEVTDNFKF